VTIFMYVGNTAPSITDTLMEVKSNGSVGPRDLNGAIVRFRMRSLFGSDLLIDSPVVIVHPPGTDGMIRYDWTLGNTTTAIDSSPGPYQGWWHLDYGGTTLDYAEFPIVFLDHNPRREVGPCTDWTSTQDVFACYTDVVAGSCLTWAVTAATEVLYELTGRQYPGYCQSVIRPCSNLGCWGPGGVQYLNRGHVIWSGHGWQDENGDPCMCGAWLQKIILPGVAQHVVEVLISGQALPASSYRLDPNNELLRTDGGAWPICQNLAANGDQPGTFQVTYSHGYTPPEIGRRAAAQLAHEFYLACNGQACGLPSGVVELTRQGVRVTRMLNLFEAGNTGLALVDSFLAAFKTCCPTYVLSPDTYPTSRRTA
jgi:hypothetical protein